MREPTAKPDRKTVLVKPLDDLVRRRLRTWPQRPPGTMRSTKQPGVWLRGRPGEKSAQPFLKLPGTSTYRTLPDGLWLHFSPDRAEPYVDILCIEACSSIPNLQDKRARFAPSTSSLLVVCPLAWLVGPVAPDDPLPRWRLIRLCPTRPITALTLPVRDVRVLYGLKAPHYEGFARHQMPHPHEYFCPMEALTAEEGHAHPDLAALIGRACSTAHFMTMP